MDNLQFKVSSALKDLIGRDLINNENVAIFELVKNSYDAYAKKVEITFENDKIIIADNGKGMSYDDLINKWLFLAYSAKKDGTEDSDEKQKSYRDKINRHYAGAKGVGRFSCDRLGEQLVLITKTANSDAAEKLVVNWADFEKDQKDEFIHINVQHETLKEKIVFPANSTTGTVLEITQLRTIWDRTKLLKLKNSLEKLINPFSETLDFNIEIICENEKSDDAKSEHEKKIVNGVIKNTIANVITLKTTKIEVKLLNDIIETTLIDRDTEIYKIREKNNFDKLESVSINLYFLNTVAKSTFTKTMGTEPKNYGSVFLFRNGFRILPFGEQGDDSWGLDYRAQQGYNRYLSSRELFGRVDIQTDKIDEFKEVSSRDGGLIESTTTIQLIKGLFPIVLKRLERYVSGVLWGEGFLKREYFKNQSEVQKSRELLAEDKNKDSAEFIINSSIGSKIDFVQLVKTLINDKNIEVLSYNKDLANIFGEPELFDKANPQVFDDLEKIAQNTNDSELLFSISEAKKKLFKLQKEKYAAERRAEEAELQAYQANAEKEKAQYEEKIAKEKQKEAEEETVSTKKQLNKKIEQLKIVTSLSSQDIESVVNLHHQINVISTNIQEILRTFVKKHKDEDNSFVNELVSKISFENDRIFALSRFGIKKIYDNFTSKDKLDLVEFLKNYIEKISTSFTSKNQLNIYFESSINNFVTEFAPIDISIIVDNMVSNARKAKASALNVRIIKNKDFVIIEFLSDKPFDADISNLNEIFEKGFSTTKSTGVGLSHIKMITDENGWSINAQRFDNKALFQLSIKEQL